VGSILALPLLLALGMGAKPAIATSLAIVGLTAAVAATRHARAGHVSWRAALVFGPTTMLGGYLGGRLAGALPAEWLLLGFAVLLVGAAVAMWRPRPPPRDVLERSAGRVLAAAGAGAAVGSVAGLVGAGGGFLFVPALTLLLGLPLRDALGTSLVVITANAIAALLGHLSHATLELSVAGPVTAGALLGALLGTRISAGTSERWLRRAFALFLLGIAGWMLARNPLVAG
jgi:uncharacterized membrane protein YfcA